MFIFTNHENSDFLEFSIGDDDTPILMQTSDTVVHIKFSVNGFSGEAGEYVLCSNLTSFANAVLELERTRTGHAILPTPVGDVSFQIKSIDQVGHIGIIFDVTEYGFLGDEYKEYRASGFFEIDPQQLHKFAKEEWVSIYNTSNKSKNMED